MYNSGPYIDEELCFELVPLLQQHTGLPCITWITTRTGSEPPWMMVQGDTAFHICKDLLFKISLAEPPVISGSTGSLAEKDLVLLKRFVTLNKAVLMDFWNEKNIDVVSIISKIIKVEI